MDFRFTPEQEAFRREILQWIKEEIPPDLEAGWENEYGAGFEFTRQIAKKLGARGWLGLTWPRKYGGQERSFIDQMIYNEEMTYHNVPGTDMGVGGITWVGPSLIHLGTEEQKQEHVLPLVAGERFWCTGYSEPESGSDMAAAMCRAVAKGDDYVVNGQKIWTSVAHIADWCWLLARTGPPKPKHKGLSLFVVDMKSPGITVRPLLSMAGHHHFNEVFFDDVHVPKKNLVGEENRGWQHVLEALDLERTTGIPIIAIARRSLDDLIAFAKATSFSGKPLSKEPLVRHELAQLAIEAEAARTLAYRLVWLQEKGEMSAAEAAAAKLFGSELVQKVIYAGCRIMGPYSQVKGGSRWTQLNGFFEKQYQECLGLNIAAGTSEIQRNIIAGYKLGIHST